jgi:hypothetical protein
VDADVDADDIVTRFDRVSRSADADAWTSPPGRSPPPGQSPGGPLLRFADGWIKVESLLYVRNAGVDIRFFYKKKTKSSRNVDIRFSATRMESWRRTKSRWVLMSLTLDKLKAMVVKISFTFFSTFFYRRDPAKRMSRSISAGTPICQDVCIHPRPHPRPRPRPRPRPSPQSGVVHSTMSKWCIRLCHPRPRPRPLPQSGVVHSTMSKWCGVVWKSGRLCQSGVFFYKKNGEIKNAEKLEKSERNEK